MRPYRLIFYFLSVTLTGYSTKYLELIFEAYARSQNLDLKAYLPWNPTVQQICGK